MKKDCLTEKFTSLKSKLAFGHQAICENITETEDTEQEEFKFYFKTRK